MAEIRVNATGAVKLYDNDDSHFVGLQAGSVSSNVTFTLPTADGSNGQFLKTDGSGALSFGSVSSSGAYDLNGGELVLDADADTSITADTDDQIDIRIAGADDFQFTANTFTAQSGSTIAAQALTATTVVGSGAAQFATAGIGAAKDLGSGLHIKTADSGVSSVDGAADELIIEGVEDSGLSIITPNDHFGIIRFGDPDDNDVGAIEYSHTNNFMRLYTNASEKVRIDSSGNVGLGVSTMGGKLHVERSDNAIGIKTSCTSASYDSTVTLFEGDRNTSNNSYSIIQGKNGGGMTFQVQDSGNVLNTNNSYGSLSDSRVKQDIDDASSQWDDIKALKIRKFKLKKYVNRDGADNTPYHLGVIAQELEASGMNGLVEENKPEKEDVALSSDFGTVVDGTADNGAVPIIDDDGNITGYEDVFTAGQNKKEVKYSILYMKAIKALQEAMAKIESLEARVTTLEG
jgi:hypothetical protein